MIVASVKTWLQATKICKTLYLELKVVVNPLILSQNTRISYARLCQHKAVSAINRGDSIRKVTYSLSTKHYLNSNHVRLRDQNLLSERQQASREVAKR